ncbi:MAG: hypothetical protein IPM23_04720 [Candidatus Melainabacteria bacterium]|nr:hypothetical protein [Candidatus Melainabacteria bacterium]
MLREGEESRGGDIPGGKLFPGWLFIILCASWTGLVCYFYVRAENALYWSDYNYYRYMTWFLKEQALASPFLALLMVLKSTDLTYNLLFAVPLLPFAIVFGDSRLVYIVSSALVYFLPCSLLLGSIAGAGLSDRASLPRSLVAGAATLATLLVPALWAPVLRGYPDYAAAIPVLAALVIYMRDESLGRGKVALLGVLLALAPLLRRHFFYLSFALAAALLIHQFYLASRNKMSLAAFLKGPFLCWCGIGMVSGLTLATLGFLFLKSILSSNFMALYASACVSVSEGAGYFITAYGALSILLALCGFAVAPVSGVLDRSRAVLVISFACLSFLVWPLFGRHIAAHYVIYAAPLVVLGNSFLLAACLESSRATARVAAGIGLAVIWAVNFIVGFLPAGLAEFLPFHRARFGMLTVCLSEPDLAGRLFSAFYPPLKRKDIHEMERLFSFLKKTVKSPQSSIFIASGNDILAVDILRNCERGMTGNLASNSLKLVEPPILDSRDALPLEGLLASELVVVCDPLVSMYKDESAHILRLVPDCFKEGWPLSRDFEKIDETFHLDGPTTVSVYRRVRPTAPAVAVATLAAMKNRLPVKTSGQPPWISTDEDYVSQGQQGRLKLRVGTGSDSYILGCVPMFGPARLSGLIYGGGAHSGAAELYSPDGNLLGSFELKLHEGRYDAPVDLAGEFYPVLRFGGSPGGATVEVEPD